MTQWVSRKAGDRNQTISLWSLHCLPPPHGEDTDYKMLSVRRKVAKVESMPLWMLCWHRLLSFLLCISYPGWSVSTFLQVKHGCVFTSLCNVPPSYKNSKRQTWSYQRWGHKTEDQGHFPPSHGEILVAESEAHSIQFWAPRIPEGCPSSTLGDFLSIRQTQLSDRIKSPWEDMSFILMVSKPNLDDSKSQIIELSCFRSTLKSFHLWRWKIWYLPLGCCLCLPSIRICSWQPKGEDPYLAPALPTHTDSQSLSPGTPSFRHHKALGRD